MPKQGVSTTIQVDPAATPPITVSAQPFDVPKDKGNWVEMNWTIATANFIFPTDGIVIDDASDPAEFKNPQVSADQKTFSIMARNDKVATFHYDVNVTHATSGMRYTLTVDPTIETETSGSGT